MEGITLSDKQEALIRVYLERQEEVEKQYVDATLKVAAFKEALEAAQKTAEDLRLSFLSSRSAYQAALKTVSIECGREDSENWTFNRSDFCFYKEKGKV